MNQTSIHFKPHTIEIETIADDRRTIKPTNLQAVQEIMSRGERITTPLLPFGWGVQKYTRVNNREQYVIATPETRHSSSYDMRSETGEDGIKEYDMVAPASIWIIYTEIDPRTDKRRYVHGNVYAIKQQVLSLQERLYHYPFANTTPSYICWGSGSDYPELNGSKSLMTIPDRFFSNPFNGDLDGGKFNSFQSKIASRNIVVERTLHLLRHMDKEIKAADKKGEVFRFPNDILRPDTSLQQAIESGAQRYLQG